MIQKRKRGNFTMVIEVQDEFKKYLERTDKLDETRKSLNEKYNKDQDISASRRLTMLTENEKVYAEKVKEARATYSEIVDGIITIARNTLYKKIMVEIPADVTPMIESIRAMGDAGTLTDMQVRAYLDKYRDIYPAFNALVSLAHKYNVCKDVFCISPDVLENDLKYVEEVAIGVFSRRFEAGESNIYLGIACEDPHIKAIDVRFNNFMNGNFDDPYANDGENDKIPGLAEAMAAHQA